MHSTHRRLRAASVEEELEALCEEKKYVLAFFAILVLFIAGATLFTRPT